MEIANLLWKAHGDEATASNPRVFEIVAWSSLPSEELDDDAESSWETFVQDLLVSEDMDTAEYIYTHCFLGVLDEIAIVHYFEDDSYELCACKGEFLFTQEYTNGNLLECRRLFALAIQSPRELKASNPDAYSYWCGN